MSIILPALLMLASPGNGSLPTIDEIQFEECTRLAFNDPKSALVQAGEWSKRKDDYRARACQGFALANDFRFADALPVLTRAAQAAEDAHDQRAAKFWAAAGNAAIGAGQAEDALPALDRAITGPMPLGGNERAECQIDRARALVALGRDAEAVKALEDARSTGPENGSAWLYSATLARRMGALEQALGFIQTAATLAPTDPAVALEAGNIAFAGGDDAAARKQWQQAIAIAPKSRQADTARDLLAQLDSEAAPAPGP